MNKKSEQGLTSIITGERGETRVKDFFLSWGWLARSISGSLDQGLDLIVEVAAEGRGLGVHFGVQSRATADQKIKKGHHRTTLKANTLAYQKRQNFPVFIIRVSTNGTEIYWISLQQGLRGSSKNNKGDVSIKIPVAGAFSAVASKQDIERDREIFLAEVRRVDPTLKEFHTRAAILAQEQELVAIDSRLDVSITASSKGRLISISAKEPVTLKTTLFFTEEREALKFQEALQYGTETVVNFDKLKMVGSPLLEHITTADERGVLMVGGEQLERVGFKIGARRLGVKNASMLTMDGHLTRGVKGFKLVAKSTRHPLASVLKFNGENLGGGFDLTMVNQGSVSGGELLVQMDRLEKASSVLAEIGNAKEFSVWLDIDGEDSESNGVLSEERAASILQTSAMCAALVPLREIARIYKPDLKVGKFADSSGAELSVWSMAAKVLEGKESISNIPGMTLQGDFSGAMGDLFSRRALGAMLVRPFGLQVFAFGEFVCEIPCEVFIKGFEIERVLTNGVMSAAELLRTDSSVMLIRRYIQGAAVSKWSIAEANDVDAEIEALGAK